MGAVIGERGLRAALDLIGELHELTGPDAFLGHVALRLHDLIGCDLVSINVIDLSGATPSTSAVYPDRPASGAASQERYSTLIGHHPLIADLIRSGDPRPRRMSDFVTRSELERLDFYQEIFRPVGTRHQIALAAHQQPTLAGLGLDRFSRDFTDAELELVALLRPHLAAAHEHLRVRSLLAGHQSQTTTADLTGREREILVLLGSGISNRQIAARLFVSTRTVEKHIEHLYAKLGVSTRTAAARLAWPLLAAEGPTPLHLHSG